MQSLHKLTVSSFENTPTYTCIVVLSNRNKRNLSYHIYYQPVHNYYYKVYHIVITTTAHQLIIPERTSCATTYTLHCNISSITNGNTIPQTHAVTQALTLNKHNGFTSSPSQVYNRQNLPLGYYWKSKGIWYSVIALIGYSIPVPMYAVCLCTHGNYLFNNTKTLRVWITRKLTLCMYKR